MFVLAAPATAAQRIAEVRGNHVLPDDEVRALVEGPDGLRRLQDAYIQNGYLFARFRTESVEGDSTLVVYIDEGELPRYGRVRVTGVQRFSPESVRQTLGVENGSRYTASRLRQGIDDLLERYDRDGYPFAQVWVDSMQLDAGSESVDLSIYVVEGGVKKISSVQVEGLKQTREDLVVKLSGLEVGRPYDGAKVRESYLRLTNTGIFDEVSFPTIRVAPEGDGVQALLRVVEPDRRHSFSAAFGYADREADADRVLSGFVRVEFNNIGGTLRDLNVLWRNDGAGRSETRLGFKQRFIFGRRMSLGLTLEQIGLDTLYTWQSVGVETSAPVGRIFGGLLSVDLAGNGDRNTFSTGDIAQTLRWRLRGGYTFALGDGQNGSAFQVMNRLTYARKRLDERGGGDAGSVNQTLVEVGASTVTRLATSLRFATRLDYRSVESNEALVPLSEQYYVGGAATLRGYRENQFHGRRVAWAQLELMVGRSRFENGYLFVDGGYILQQSEAPDSTVQSQDTYRAGYGFGLRTQSPLGNIDISFGVGEKFSLRQTKVHVILNRRF